MVGPRAAVAAIIRCNEHLEHDHEPVCLADVAVAQSPPPLRARRIEEIHLCRRVQALAQRDLDQLGACGWHVLVGRRPGRELRAAELRLQLAQQLRLARAGPADHDQLAPAHHDSRLAT